MEAITVLVPCKDQRREFLLDALASLTGQTCGEWEALVLTDPESPAHVAEWAMEAGDARIRVCPCPVQGFAQALNFGLAQARTTFAAILLSDDRYDREAIATLQAYRRRFPEADFFHSARRHINQAGERWGGVMASRSEFTLGDFERGSPVKHLLCWRRELALSIGGMDETLSVHGCDDYDFPWRMAEAGARFQAVAECLYEYRLHHAHDRLTTTVPLDRQIGTLRTMFARHGVAAATADRFAQRAIGGYFVAEFTDQIDNSRGALAHVRCFREAPESRRAEFVGAGFKERHFFPHRVFVVPKGGPDGYKLATRMLGATDPGRMLEFLLYAAPPLDEAFPDALYFDDEVQWHQQQFGLRGQVGCANVWREAGGRALRCTLLLSDLVQRISRAPVHRTQIDNRFKGWSRLLLHAILDYARDNGLETVYVPTARLALRYTDPKRNPQAPLYERIYDTPAREFGAEADGEWWRLAVDRLGGRMVGLERSVTADRWGKVVCLLHDTERGMGHRTADPEFGLAADREAPGALERMLQVEAEAGVRATYSVVGKLLRELRPAIAAGGHAIAFHSYDHVLPGEPGAPGGADGSEQLAACRSVDYRIKGYRPPQSKILAGLNDANLAYQNFEWLASSRHSLGTADPVMANGIVKIPVHLDDYKLYRHGVAVKEWEREVLELVVSRDFVVIGLHDCYAPYWLDGFAALLEELQSRATLLTLDEVAARVTLGHSRWFQEG